ncbi:HAD hydrolase family protein [Streptomyces sp. NPDC059340]|uniref:HAD hydrolase family protein n=1 Tax=Streptomyces sp. NPDC059340 TaxID=3346806 RepID=UPI0036A854D6
MPDGAHRLRRSGCGAVDLLGAGTAGGVGPGGGQGVRCRLGPRRPRHRLGAGRRFRRRANDTGLLAAAGLGVAVANASAGVREAADALTACDDDDGLAAWLEGMCLCHV